eukprot:1157644-Pelagomonas_calceolata.AAC.3
MKKPRRKCARLPFGWHPIKALRRFFKEAELCLKMPLLCAWMSLGSGNAWLALQACFAAAGRPLNFLIIWPSVVAERPVAATEFPDVSDRRKIDELSKAVNSSSAKGKSASKRASKRARTSKGMRTGERECEKLEEEEGSEESEDGKAAVRRTAVRVRGGSWVHHVAVVMRRARRGVAALRVNS